jgi:hypothetical protein
MSSARFWSRNFFGAFADGAVLFPLLAALSARSGFNSTTLLATAGAAYVAAALVFRVPMSVQPLKSIAIAGLALGASFDEIRVSGALLGLVCLALALTDVNRLAARVPTSLVHGIQAGLGVLLVFQGMKSVPSPSSQPLTVLVLLAAIVVLTLASVRWELPALGMVATAGLAYALFSKGTVPDAARTSSEAGVRLNTVVALVAPQMALTLANSVLGTENVARRYFGDQAERVTARRLLASIGLGNVVSSVLGGLPFCHGSGGLTAHVRGGSTHWVSGMIVGGTLLFMATIQAVGGSVTLNYPAALMACLLVVTGLFHFTLARPTWASAGGKVKLALMMTTAVISRNMLHVLLVGVACESAAGLLLRKRTV